MLNNYKSIIWDWNGTLLNDVHICVDIINHLLTQQNQPQLTIDRYKSAFGFPIVDYYRRIGIDFEQESFEALTMKFMGSYTQQVKECALHEQTLSVLSALRQKGLNQFILTAAHKDNVMELLHHYDIQHYFKAIEGLDNFRAESKIQRGHHLIQNHQINPQTTVLIGDTLHDHDVAQALNVDCILVADGHQSWERLNQNSSNNTLVINNLSEIIHKLN